MSRAVVAWQGNIAGRGHANSLLLVLTLRALRRAHAIAPTVQPRGLADDVTLAWARPSAGHSKDLANALGSFTRQGLHEKVWARNLGHELHGRKVIRTQEKRRLASLMDRGRRLAMLRRAAGRRAAALVATGLSPSAGHGAGVAGLADRPLAQLRTLSAAAAGAKAGCGTAAVMLLQKRVGYDPIYAATVRPVVRLASRIGEGIGPPATLAASWDSLAAVAMAGASAYGPLAAKWLSLERIGWSMQSVWALRSDIGELRSMLHTAPRGIKDALVEGIQRWQCRRAALWSGGHYTNVWRHSHGFTDTEVRHACGEARDTLMHRWRCCLVVMVPMDDGLEQEEPFRKPLGAVHQQMHEAEQRWTVGDSYLPVLARPSAAARATACSALDDPGHASKAPEARWRGWAVLAFRPDGFQLKAACGPLPGAVQTVGRAERFACLAPLRQRRPTSLIVSDLQSLMTEGNSWSPDAASARGRHAGIWGQLHAAAAARAVPPPRFRWAPAHRTLEQAIEEGIRPLDWLGNCWADFFANLGAAEIKLPDSATEAIHAELQRALDTADNLGWAAARICQVDLWRPPGEDGELKRKFEPKLLAGPQLSLTRRGYQTVGVGGVQCIRCGREANTDKVRAAKSQSAVGAQRLASSEAANLSLQVADLVETQVAQLGPASVEKAQYLLAAAKGPALTKGPGSAGRPPQAWDRSGDLEDVLAQLVFCERGRQDGAPFREAHIDQAQQLEGEAFRVRVHQFRGYLAAGRAFLCDRGNALHVGANRQRLHTPVLESPTSEADEDVWVDLDDDDMELIRGLQASDLEATRARREQGEAAGRGGEALGVDGGEASRRRSTLPPESEGEILNISSPDARRWAHRHRRQPAGPPPDGEGGGSPPSSSSTSVLTSLQGLQLLRHTLMDFAAVRIFDLRGPDGAERSWLAWAARFAMAWLRQPDNAAACQEAAKGAGSIGVLAIVKAMVGQAWQRKASVRQATRRHLLDLSFSTWHHVAAMQWASTGEVARAIEAQIGPTAAAQLPELSGFAGPLSGIGPRGVPPPPRAAMVLLAAAGPPAFGQARGAMTGRGHGRPQLPLPQQLGRADSDSDDDGPDPGAAPSGLQPPPPAGPPEAGEGEDVLPGAGGGAGPEFAPADDVSWHVDRLTEGPDSSSSFGGGANGTAAAGGAEAGDPAAEADIIGFPQWAAEVPRTPE
ncbi:unnamed protein product, partial [Prorocentrum cordatum]